MTLTLSPVELIELTAHRRSDAQRRALDFMGVPYLVRPDGSLVVLRSALERRDTMKPREPELQP